jgi:Ca2+-binding RTX toxin-like protein
MALPVFWTDERLANTETAGGQTDTKVTALSGGGFVITWRDDADLDGDGSSIQFQIYDVFGQKVGAQLQANYSRIGEQFAGDIAALSTGGFAITWADASTGQIRLQVFAANGSLVGGEVDVSVSATGGADPAIAALDSGGLVVVWAEFNANNVSSDVYMQRYDDTGQPLGGKVAVAMTTADFQGRPAVAATGDGHFVVAWQDLSQSGGDTSSHAVRMQRFEDDGDPAGGEALVNTTTTGNQNSPAVAGMGNGDFVISWSDDSGVFDNNVGGVVGQYFDAAGAKVGVEFLVNELVQGPQGVSALTSLPGGFVAVYSSGNENYDGSDIALRMFQTDGTGTPAASDGEILVNADDGMPLTATTQFWPALAVLADGRIVVAWEDDSATGGDSDGSAIRYRILDPRQGVANGSGESEAMAGSAPGSAMVDDVMRGFGGDDAIFGLDGNDMLFGGAGDDQVFGGAGNDTLFGEEGNDHLRGEAGADRIFGNAGADLVLGGAGNDNLNGGSGNDRMFGENGNDRLSGSSGNDRLHGGAAMTSTPAGPGATSSTMTPATTARSASAIFVTARTGSTLTFPLPSSTSTRRAGMWL